MHQCDRIVEYRHHPHLIAQAQRRQQRMGRLRIVDDFACAGIARYRPNQAGGGAGRGVSGLCGSHHVGRGVRWQRRPYGFYRRQNLLRQAVSAPAPYAGGRPKRSVERRTLVGSDENSPDGRWCRRGGGMARGGVQPIDQRVERRRKGRRECRCRRLVRQLAMKGHGSALYAAGSDAYLGHILCSSLIASCFVSILQLRAARLSG